MKLINELNTLEVIGRLEKKYLRHFGAEPYNISHWDPAPNFQQSLVKYLRLSNYKKLIDYTFSYTLPMRDQLLEEFGFSPKSKGCLITPTGSVSILCIVNWLKWMEYRRITALCPVYFTLIHNCKKENINITKLYMVRKESAYFIPNEELKDETIKILWLTNPTYCTGVHLTKEDVNALKVLLQRGVTIIADECLAVRGYELSYELGHYQNFMGIYAPHKTICINGIKFSMLVFDKQYQEFFDQWSDVLYGCLSASNVTAINHFLSPDFAHYEKQFFKKIDEAIRFIENLSATLSNVELDRMPKGYLTTGYFPPLDSENALKEDFLWEVVKNTGGTFIPGIRNHFDPHIGFCFRINLSRDNPRFRSTLARLFRFLSDIC